jgi:hypothetical protein
MAAHRIEEQIEMLAKAKSFLQQHAESLDEQVKDMRSQIRSLEQDELNHDYLDFLEEFQTLYTSKLTAITEEIEGAYIPSIQRKMQHLEDRV